MTEGHSWGWEYEVACWIKVSDNSVAKGEEEGVYANLISKLVI